MSASVSSAPVVPVATGAGTRALTRHHRQLRQQGADLLNATRDGGTPADDVWRQQWVAFESALWQHELVEESFLHPAMQSATGDDKAAVAAAVVATVRWHGQLEHRRRALFDRFRVIANGENTELLTDDLRRLLDEHDRHFSHEEESLFPFADTLLTDTEQEMIDRALVNQGLLRNDDDAADAPSA